MRPALLCQQVWAVILGTLIWLTSSVDLRGQENLSEKEEEALILARQWEEEKRSHERELAKQTRTFRRYFVDRLVELEHQAADERAYALAIKLRDRRRGIVEALARFDPERQRKREANALTLEPREAVLSGPVVLKDAILERWRTNKSLATWNLHGLEPGIFEVVASYSCASKVEESTDADGNKVRSRAGGVFTFGEHSKLIDRNGRRLTHRVLPTDDWETFRDVTLGTLEIDNPASVLRLEVVQVGALGLMKLKHIRLYPLGEEAPPPPPAVLPLEETRRAFKAALARKMQRLQQTYLKRLEGLRNQARLTGDGELAGAIEKAMADLNNK